MESCENGYLASLEAGKHRGKFYRIFGSSYSLNHECEAGMIITIHIMRFYTKRRKMPSITIVSLIDILAILLIFFIVTTTFRERLPQLQINLPESKAAASAPQEAKKIILLQIKGPDEIMFDGKAVTSKNLAAAIKDAQKRNPGCSITMQADKEAPFGAVVTVLDALQEAGIKNIPAIAKPVAK
jgi:biopolymer transport protein ExbD